MNVYEARNELKSAHERLMRAMNVLNPSPSDKDFGLTIGDQMLTELSVADEDSVIELLAAVKRTYARFEARADLAKLPVD